MRFKNIVDVTNIPDRCDEIFDDALKTILADLQPNDFIGMDMRHPKLDKPILIPFMLKNQITGQKILNIIERILQSKTEVTFDDQLTVSVMQT